MRTWMLAGSRPGILGWVLSVKATVTIVFLSVVLAASGAYSGLLKLDTPVYITSGIFGKNSADISPEGLLALDKVAQAIKSLVRPGFKIKITAHTSAEGPDTYNLQLSKQRAKAVADYLVLKWAVPQACLETDGQGARQPLISPEKTDQDREYNRRVEFENISTPDDKQSKTVGKSNGKDSVLEKGPQSGIRKEAPPPDRKSASGKQSKANTLEPNTVSADKIAKMLTNASRVDKPVKAPTGKPQAPESRFALVIGNAAYKECPPLQNPVNDAQDMGQALRACGFEVAEVTDGSYDTMNRAIEEFGKRIQGCDVALFYYGGHGVQIEGRAYLAPVDAKTKGNSAKKCRFVHADAVLTAMKSAGCHVKIIILDTDRDNPFPGKWESNRQGASIWDLPEDTVLAFATAEGKYAVEGQGRNGLYTEHLLKHLREPGVSIDGILGKVRAEVAKATRGAQVPWRCSTLTKPFCLVPRAVAGAR